MNILLWLLQVLLALHTVAGAAWKFSHSAGETMPSLGVIPHGAWLAMSVVEILCAVALILPALSRRLGILAPLAAALIAAEMLLFCVLHFQSGNTTYSPVIYWLVVVALSAFIVYGRLVLRPFR